MAAQNPVATTFRCCCDGNNLRSNESVGGVQLDTYGVHHQTSHCRAERDEKGEKVVDTELIGPEMRVCAHILNTAADAHNFAVYLLQAVAG